MRALVGGGAIVVGGLAAGAWWRRRSHVTARPCAAPVAEEPLPAGGNIVNLTPHAVGLYSVDKQLMFSIPPAFTPLRLKTATASGLALEGPSVEIASRYFEDCSTSTRAIVREDAELTGMWETYATCPLLVRRPVSYEGIEGLEQFKNSSAHGRLDILVSTMVAEFLMQRRDEYIGLCSRVFVPDTDPSAVVRGTDGAIVGTRRLVYYGSLHE
jgi:hypothetical protein